MDIKTIERDSNGKLPAFAWPGGYPIVYYSADMAEFCPACANGENGSRCCDPTLDIECPDDDQWRLVAADIYFEGPTIQCAHCNKDIESAYGDPNEEKH